MSKTKENDKPARQEQAPPQNQLALMKRDVVDVVTGRVQELVGSGELHLPANYSAPNAMKAAWLALQSVEDRNGNKALAVCTKDSIANALLDMVIQGLTPARNQCYFIVYGKSLACQRSYFGDQSIAKRIIPGAQIAAEPIYQGDEVEYEIVRGKKVVTKHRQKLSDVKSDADSIVGGYCQIYDGEDGPLVTGVIMTMEQIKKSWEKSKTWRPGKPGTFHEDQPHHAVRRTVMRRACTEIINTADDSYLVLAARRQAELSAEAALEAEMEEEANGELLALEGDEEPETIDLAPEPEVGADPEAAPKAREGGQAGLMSEDPGF